MTLNNKLAFEIWVGIVLLIVLIGGVAGATLLLDHDATSVLTRTQVNAPKASSLPGTQEAATAIGSVLSGGVAP